MLVAGITGGSALGGCLMARAESARISFDEIYRGRSALGLEYSERARSLVGQRVRMLGYMAPPLKPDARFFVLTRKPVSVCPFCSSDADWPSDIVVVILRDELDNGLDGLAVEVEGVLELGTRRDALTGFVSQVRLVDAQCKRYRP